MDAGAVETIAKMQCKIDNYEFSSEFVYQIDKTKFRSTMYFIWEGY